jgi:transcription initiation factor TFIID subunit 10
MSVGGAEKVYRWSDDLCYFFEALDTYSPTVPESVVKYNLQKSGFTMNDNRILKLVALATDKFLTDIIKEAVETSKLRKSSNKRKKNESVLEMVNYFIC